MNCQKAQSLISAYLDGELTGQEMLAIRHHLCGCTECSGEYESLLAIKRTFGKLLPKRPVDDLAVRICSKLAVVHVPFHVRVSAGVRNYFRSFPAGVRVGAAGIAVIAMLLMIRGGEVTVPSHLGGIPISASILQTSAQDKPLHVVTVAEDYPTAIPAAYDMQPTRWQPSAGGQLIHLPRTGSLMPAEY